VEGVGRMSALGVVLAVLILLVFLRVFGVI
jgi:hypothetical protein